MNYIRIKIICYKNVEYNKLRWFYRKFSTLVMNMAETFLNDYQTLMSKLAVNFCQWMLQFSSAHIYISLQLKIYTTHWKRCIAWYICKRVWTKECRETLHTKLNNYHHIQNFLKIYQKKICHYYQVLLLVNTRRKKILIGV